MTWRRGRRDHRPCASLPSWGDRHQARRHLRRTGEPATWSGALTRPGAGPRTQVPAVGKARLRFQQGVPGGCSRVLARWRRQRRRPWAMPGEMVTHPSWSRSTGPPGLPGGPLAAIVARSATPSCRPRGDRARCCVETNACMNAQVRRAEHHDALARHWDLRPCCVGMVHGCILPDPGRFRSNPFQRSFGIVGAIGSIPACDVAQNVEKRHRRLQPKNSDSRVNLVEACSDLDLLA